MTTNDRARQQPDAQGIQSPEAETFKREGPTPPGNSTGESIDDMNRAAEESVVRNIRPDEHTD
jgi:hypothetical protein